MESTTFPWWLPWFLRSLFAVSGRTQGQVFWVPSVTPRYRTPLKHRQHPTLPWQSGHAGLAKCVGGISPCHGCALPLALWLWELNAGWPPGQWGGGADGWKISQLQLMIISSSLPGMAVPSLEQ